MAEVGEPAQAPELGVPTASLTAQPEPVPRQSSGLVRGTSWSTLNQLVQLVGVLGLTPFMLARLGLERYGLLVLALTVVSVLGSFDGGVSASAQRYLAVYTGKGDVAASARLLTTLTLGVVVVGGAVAGGLALAAHPVLHLFGVGPDLLPSGTFLFRVMTGVAVLTIVRGLFLGLLNAHQRYGATNSVLIGANLFFYAAMFAVLGNGGALHAIAYVFLVQAAGSLTATVLLARPLLRGAGAAVMPGAELRTFLAFAARFQLVGLSTLVTLQTDSLVVGAVTSVRNVGVYNLGANFSNQLRSIPVNGLGPVLVTLGNAWGEHGVGATATFAALQRRWVQLVTAWCAVGLGAAYVGMHVWLGPRAAQAPVLALVLLAGNTVNLWTGAVTVWLGVSGHAGVEARYATLGAVLNIALTAALVVPFGAYGVAAATAVGQALSSVYLLRVIARRVEFDVPSFLADVPWLGFAATTGAVALLELAARPVLPEGVAGLLAAGVVALPGFVVFAVIVWGPAATAAAVRGGVVRLRSRKGV